jgi:hypothetical protein
VLEVCSNVAARRAARVAAAATRGQAVSGPQYRPEPESPVTPDLFAIVDVVDEYSLGQRLIQHGADLYVAGDFASFAERLRYVIVRWQLATVVCGRDAGGKLEHYAAAFARVTGEPLVAKKVWEKASR